MGPYRPSLDECRQWAGQAGRFPVYRVLQADHLTPVSAFGLLHRGGPGFLFESVVGGEKVGRYSFLGTEPFLRFEAFGEEVRLRTSEGGERVETPGPGRTPLDVLEEVLRSHRTPQLSGMPRFLGGAVGYAAYDVVRYLERLPNAPPDDRGLPELSFGLYGEMVVFDHIRKVVMVVALGEVPREAAGWPGAYQEACRRVDRLVDRLSQPVTGLRPRDITLGGDPSRPARSNFTREEFEAVVRRCQEYIRAGDVFQVVPSQRFEVRTTALPFDIYRALRIINPSPFLFYLDLGGELALVGSSPEILVRVEEGEVTVRPIAGTRRRGRDEQEDAALAADLLSDKKERAEHVMLVDLGRNDVGRVAEAGSVRISELMVVERYSHVMHITSNVTGRLASGRTAFDALKAGMPAGTVSGAPKVRAMEILDELEPQRRGPYAGAVGYFDFSGNMDMCIALRTIVCQGDRAYVQAGAGVVYDSDPAAEYEETCNKAKAMLRAIELAEGEPSGEQSLGEG
ncbi:MAG: anthranilate synthase component I [Isosphaeraceae bacterium]|jgi:anthranilate synthase component 1|nr:MAG: anthranilate synthase component I [Isosphaeraceae bacterium]